MGASDVSILPQRSVILPTTVFAAGSATDVPLVLQGAASQTGNLTEWRNNVGTVIAYVGFLGFGYFSDTLSVGGPTVGTNPNDGSAQLLVNPRAAAAVGLRVRGAANQTGSLQEFQDSNNVILTTIDSRGTIRESRSNYIKTFLYGGTL